MFKRLAVRLRGIVGTGVSWAMTWAAGALILHPLAGLLGASGLVGNGLLQDMVMTGMMGLSGGMVFAAGLTISERHRSLADRLRSGALWGILAGLSGPGAIALALGDFSPFLSFVWTNPLWLGSFLALGAGSGAAMTAIAKSSAPPGLDPPKGPGRPASTRHPGLV